MYLLQTLLIVPYYQNQKTNQVDGIIEAITEVVSDSKSMTAVGSLAYNNLACVMILNDKGDQLYTVDNIGDSCVLNKHNSSFNLAESFAALQSEEKTTVREFINYSQVERSSLVVGKKIKANLFNYYVFVNVLVVPVASTTSILRNLLIIASLIAIVVAFIISWYFSSAIAQPIMTMKEGADQLALGNYNTKFTGTGYHEIESLSTTLNIATERLSQLDSMRQELFSNVSHDLKTPLTNILLYSELLQEITTPNNVMQQEYLDIIQTETKYINQLVEDMKLISSSAITVNKKPFNLSKLMLELLDAFFAANTNDNLRFESFIEENIFINADALKIEQVIRNFVINALKYSNKALNVVEINLKKRNNKAIVEVCDQGEGISEEDLPLIWDRYYRGSTNFHRQKSGSGLGLSIAKSILEEHNFNYGVNSEKGKGSRFYFEAELCNGNNS